MTRPSSLLDHLDDGIAAFEADFRCTYANAPAAALCGVTLDRLVGQPLFAAVPTLRDSADGQALRDAMAARVERRFESRFDCRPAQADRRVEARAAPLGDGGLLVQWRELSPPLQRLHDELDRQQRRHDEFLALLAHDLRNPLAPLHTSLELLGRPRVPDEAKERARSIMSRQVGQLVRLIDEVVEVARLGTGAIELRTERTDLRSIVDRALQLSHVALQAKEQTVQLELPARTPPLRADPERAAQAVAALLRDLSRRSERGVPLVLRAGRDEAGGLTLAVRSTEDGAAAGGFQSFTAPQRAAGAPSPQLSVGLTLARRLALLHGGTLALHGGEGSPQGEFAIHLPPGVWDAG
jgi:signal transduction histidine kinase